MSSSVVQIKLETFQTPEQVCRLCLGEDMLEDIFKHPDHQQWISDYLSIIVSETDSISQSMCAKCRTRLKEFHDYQQRCLEVQGVLQLELQRNVSKEKQGLRLKCDVCDKQFQVHRQLKDHKKIHGPRKYNCSNCGKGFINPSRLARHMGNRKCGSYVFHKTTGDHCEDDSNFDSETVTASENTNHKDNSYLMVECESCDKKFRNKKQLRDHRRHVHGPKDHECSICGMAFITRQRLDNHSKTHLGYNTKDCTKLKSVPKVASKSKEAMTKKQSCPLCHRLIMAVSMEGHLNRHKGIQPFKCEIGCSKEKFFCNEQRKSHYQDVHGWHAYECDICHQFFHTGRSCRVHKMNAHGQGHECQDCFLKFETSAGLERHIVKANHPKKNLMVDQQVQMKHETEHQTGLELEDMFEATDIKVECRSDEDEEMAST